MLRQNGAANSKGYFQDTMLGGTNLEQCMCKYEHATSVIESIYY